MSSSWTPGVPVHAQPGRELPASDRLRRGGGRPMRWRAAQAVPGPWPWLRGGAALLDLDQLARSGRAS